VGAVARYGLSGLVQRQVEGSFPAGTLAVNLLGCILLGAFMTLVRDQRMFEPRVRLFVTIGVLGSLTTFSTFGYETIQLLRAGELNYALLNIAANLVLGLAGVLIGRGLVRIWA